MVWQARYGARFSTRVVTPSSEANPSSRSRKRNDSACPRRATSRPRSAVAGYSRLRPRWRPPPSARLAVAGGMGKAGSRLGATTVGSPSRPPSIHANPGWAQPDRRARARACRPDAYRRHGGAQQPLQFPRWYPPGEPLYTELAKNLIGAQVYVRFKHAMSTMRNKRQVDAADMMDEWRGFLSNNRAADDALTPASTSSTRSRSPHISRRCSCVGCRRSFRAFI
jgi:hypothetical protein